MKNLLVLALLLMSLQASKFEDSPIYQPYPDAPVQIKDKGEIFKQQNYKMKDYKQDITHQKSHAKDNSKQIEEFNQIFKIGLIAGTILLAITLSITCSTGPDENRQRTPLQTRNRSQRNRQLSQINEQINYHDNQLRRLRHQAQCIEEQEDQIERRRVYHEQQQIRIRAQERQYYQQGYQRPYQKKQRVEMIPIGKPISHEYIENSSFATEYPAL